eukprot:3925672-Alexandrium_andersonii.AAC.1
MFSVLRPAVALAQGRARGRAPQSPRSPTVRGAVGAVARARARNGGLQQVGPRRRERLGR